MTAARADTVDITKDGWWLTPYKASKEWTIGVSYTDTSISYIAALQKAVQAKAKEMGVKIIEVDAKNDTNVELANVENLLQQHIDLLLLEGASLKASVASIEAANKAERPGGALQHPRRGRRLRDLRRVQPDRVRRRHGERDRQALQAARQADAEGHLHARHSRLYHR